MGLLRFIFSKSFLINVVIAAVLFVAVILYIHFRLNAFTLHNEEIGVPDFRGYQINEIGEILERKKLNMEVIDSLYDRSLEAGAITHQDPLPGDMVKEGRRIYFTINMLSAPMVRVPSLVDVSKRQAVATLEILEINSDSITYKVSPYDGLVLDVLYKGQSIGEGGNLPLGASVKLIVGESSDIPKVMMPDLIGLRRNQVDSALRAYNLSMGSVINCEECLTSLDSNTAIVTKTYPQYKANKRVKMGSNVDIWLKKEEEL